MLPNIPRVTRPVRASEAEGSRGHLGGQAGGLGCGPLGCGRALAWSLPSARSVCFATPPPGSCSSRRSRSPSALRSPPPLRYCPAFPARVPAGPWRGLPSASLGSPHKDAACSLLKSKYKARPRPCRDWASCLLQKQEGSLADLPRWLPAPLWVAAWRGVSPAVTVCGLG